jgi:hypothetical protein
MGYFTRLADASFKTSETGERLFYWDGLWSPPYVIPDAETERRLYRKLLWVHRASLGSVIVGQPLLVAWAGSAGLLLYGLYWSPLIGLTMGSISWIVSRRLFANDLKGLARLTAPVQTLSPLGHMVVRSSRTALIAGLAASLALIAGCLWLMHTTKLLPLVILGIGFFAISAIFFGHALSLKSQVAGVPDASRDK